MRLFTLYNRVLLITSMAGLLIIGYLFYNTLSTYLNKQIDNYLVEELLEVRDYTSKRQDFPPHSEFEDLVIAYHKISRVSKKTFWGYYFLQSQKGNKGNG